MTMPVHNLVFAGTKCEGAGCSYVIEPGLKLRFCPVCRPKQTIPSNVHVNQSAIRRQRTPRGTYE